MSTRDRFFKAMRRLDSAYIPYEFILCPSLKKAFREKTGREDYEEYYDFPTRILYLDYINTADRYLRFYESSERLNINDWGIGFLSGKTDDFNEMRHPMQAFQTIKEFEQYPYPDPIVDYDWDKMIRKIKETKKRDRIAACYLEVTIFETAWYLRGMDNLFIDMKIDPEKAEYLFDCITERRCVMAKKFAQSGCDVLRLGDDVSTQLDMMMAPVMWQYFLKPRLKKVIAAAKEGKPDIMIFYHGCGNLQKIIPDLIEIGVDILNPVQPECMDPLEIKEKFGGRLSFWGTVGTQRTMPFGSTEEVKAVCLQMIEKVGKGGGFLLAPAHVLEPEVPWDNIETFVETVRNYNEGGV